MTSFWPRRTIHQDADAGKMAMQGYDYRPSVVSKSMGPLLWFFAKESSGD
jgi:hypothetical protein